MTTDRKHHRRITIEVSSSLRWDEFKQAVRNLADTLPTIGTLQYLAVEQIDQVRTLHENKE